MSEREFPPITDAMRDAFVEKFFDDLDLERIPDTAVQALVLDELAWADIRVCIDAPEFRVHTDDCCGGSGERCGHIIPCSPTPGLIGSACTLLVPCEGVPGYWPRSSE